MNDASLLECHETLVGEAPTYSVIWMHGLGADGYDFAPIVPELQLPTSPGVRFVFPHAPVQPVTINNGMMMRAWYDIKLPNLAMREDEAGIRQSEQAIRALIMRENQRGIPTSRIVLAGFSQGCAMALHTSLRLEEKLAGVVGLSGYLPLADMLENERQAANQQTPIFLAHGSMDPVVTINRAEASRDRLQSLGYQVSWHTYPMPHSVCAQEVFDIASYLRQVIA